VCSQYASKETSLITFADRKSEDVDLFSVDDLTKSISDKFDDLKNKLTGDKKDDKDDKDDKDKKGAKDAKDAKDKKEKEEKKKEA